MKKSKLRKGDEVKVVLGKDKGKVGKIEKILPKEEKVLVGGVNQYKRHVKGRTQGQKSEIITLTKPLPVSAVALICPKCHKITRVGLRIEKAHSAGFRSDESSERAGQAKKERFCRKCDKLI